MLQFDKDDELFIGLSLLSEFYDCTECGLCCRGFHQLPMYPEEITDISSYLSIDEDSFIKQFTKPCKNLDEKGTLSLQTPCVFLKDRKCIIYSHRPFVCKTYPLVINRDKNEAILSGIYFCPQATQFYEGLINFCKSRNPKHYQNLLTNEKKCSISHSGLLFFDSSLIISSYVDWLHSTENNDE